MEYTLRNNAVEIGFTTLGGTLRSIKDESGTEYLWQGDKAYWSGQAPVLFPICGSIRDDKATIGDDQTTAMPRHGIIRKREFKLEYQIGTQIGFSIESNMETRQAFPYDFKVITHYALLEKGVKVTYEVLNTGTETMPFFVGGHPGFNCPLAEGEEYSDYKLIFPQEETEDMPTPVTETGLIDMEHRLPTPIQGTTLQLSHELFAVDALILDKLQSRSVILQSDKSKKGVKVSFKDFPYLILWSTANAGPFVAIEPWTGLSTCSDEDDIFESKRNVQMARPGESRKYSFKIEII